MEYKIVYSPKNRETWRDNRGDEYVCNDGYLHVRLRKYGDRKERIVGFKDKLRFLMTYLVNYQARDAMHIKEGESAYSRTNSMLDCMSAIELANQNWGEEISNALRRHIYCIDLKGIRISARYCKDAKDKMESSMTSMIGDTIGLHYNGPIADPLLEFGYRFRLEGDWIASFLLDDGYEVAIEPAAAQMNMHKGIRRKHRLESIWF